VGFIESPLSFSVVTSSYWKGLLDTRHTIHHRNTPRGRGTLKGLPFSRSGRRGWGMRVKLAKVGCTRSRSDRDRSLERLALRTWVNFQRSLSYLLERSGCRLKLCHDQSIGSAMPSTSYSIRMVLSASGKAVASLMSFSRVSMGFGASQKLL